MRIKWKYKYFDATGRDLHYVWIGSDDNMHIEPIIGDGFFAFRYADCGGYKLCQVLVYLRDIGGCDWCDCNHLYNLVAE